MRLERTVVVKSASLVEKLEFYPKYLPRVQQPPGPAPIPCAN